MMEIEERIKQNLIRLGVKAGESVGVAVSGGMDSMTLLNCLRNLREEMNILIIAYHMEHGIRGEASVSDMEFVKAQCCALGVECVTERADVPARAYADGVSIETAARQLRYEFLGAAETDYIATAHHMEDNAETVLMNLVRGSALAGLCGIPERRGKFIRPMLDISRRDIEEYVQSRGIPFVSDATNDDTAYTRNYIRWEVLPRLKHINGAAAANIARTAALLSEDEQALVTAAVKADCIEKKDEGAYIDLHKLSALMPAVKKRVIRLAVAQTGELAGLERVHMESLSELAEKAEPGKRIDLAHGLFAAVVYGKLLVGKNGEKRYNKNSVVFCCGRLDFAGFEFDCGEYIGEPVYGDGAEYFDAEAIEGAVFRHRLEGDYIFPLGMGGKKRLSDYLSDRKVPLLRRDSLALLAKGSEVLWAVGVGVSETSKLKNGSKKIRICYWGNGHA
jgi:tRNA(Ile)-lysidine synthase